MLQTAAEAAGTSLNEYCVRRLSGGGSGLGVHPDAVPLVTRAASICGDALVGVVVYGSWARGAASSRSDVDILIVVSSSCALARSLYRDWDASPTTWEGRAVDPHFVHLPGNRPVGSVWAEAAIDGILLFERGIDVSSALASVRRAIASGQLVRRMLHGQPYWVAA